jgi:hypothetical protein
LAGTTDVEASAVDIGSNFLLHLWNWMVILHELADWNNTVLVSLDLFINIESLKFGQDLDHSSLQTCSSHEAHVIGVSKSLFTNLNSFDWLHSISNLIVLSGHELTTSCEILVQMTGSIFENQDIAFSLELDFVQNLYWWSSGLKIVVEVSNIFVGKSVEFLYFQKVGDILFEGYLISMIHFHDDDMDDVNQEQCVNSIILDFVATHEEAHKCKVEDKQNCITGRDPPVDSCLFRRQRVEETLNNQS